MATPQEIRQAGASEHVRQGARWYWFAPTKGKAMAVLFYEYETKGIEHRLTGPFDSKAEAEAAA
jgi:uncharacterized ferritin-like protein (DUF455 family)